MADTVQLRHDLPDGTWHVDWLIDLDPVGEGRLPTFRLRRRVDDLCAGESIEAERLEDHRRRYLTYEGPVKGDRGEVQRVATGRIEALQMLGDVWAMLVRWEPADQPTAVWQRLRVSRAGPAWLVQVLPIST